MVESRCGIKCGECKYREQMNCAGCLLIDKPFWGDYCPIKDCCEGRKHEHCGQCIEFPCALLTQFSYHNSEGDKGARIEACRSWANLHKTDESFDVGRFIEAVAAQNASELRTYFNDDAIIRWHDSNEQFGVEEYIRANCEYPGRWVGELQRVETASDTTIIVTKIRSDESTHFITTFARLAGGKISRLDEYYSDLNEAPEMAARHEHRKTHQYSHIN